jgi:hypothetical protein
LSWIAPIALLQLYFNAQAAASTKLKYSVAGLFVLLSLLTLCGSVAAMLFMWWPYL